tara:strand:+ start:1364 stop:3103 length:1740 start_codon:yes stop_codon:yes gene_type:complete
MKYIFIILTLASLNASSSRIMTYNILNYSNDDSREQNYISILDLVQPELIVVQEIIGQNGYDNFKTDVLDILGPGVWSSAPFINQSAQQDIALFYNQNIFTFISTQPIYTAQSSGTRDVIEWVMVHNSSGLEFIIYGVHLKASSGTSNANQRLEEVTILRNHLNNLDLNTKFIVSGDFNIYSNNSSSEPAFDMLTTEGGNSQGQLFDPINRIGNWHNNSSFADVHTQSPRTTQFGGGANGGMDDRFDWLFISGTMLSTESDIHYMEDTYEVVGNDGNHFNDAINNGTNSVVSSQIANALHSASDHLPVYMDVWFDDLVFGDSSVVISEIMANPASVSDSYGEWFEIVNISQSSVDLNGWVIKDAQDNQHTVNNLNSDFLILPGEYLVFARSDDLTANGGLNSDYVYSGISLSNSEDALILTDSQDAIIDEVRYDNSWGFTSGISLELHDITLNNNNRVNWYESENMYGAGDLGTPGTSFNDTLGIINFKDIPKEFNLSNPYPNPFNPSTVFIIDNPYSQVLQMNVLNIKGQIIDSFNDDFISKNGSRLTWNAKEYATGIYFFQLSNTRRSIIKKVIYIK